MPGRMQGMAKKLPSEVPVSNAQGQDGQQKRSGTYKHNCALFQSKLAAPHLEHRQTNSKLLR